MVACVIVACFRGVWCVDVTCFRGVLMLGVFPVSGAPPKVSADQFEDLLGGVLMRGVWCVDACGVWCVDAWCVVC